VNGVLVSSGRPAISEEVYLSWHRELVSDAVLTRHYASVVPVLRANSKKAISPDWQARVERIAHMVDLFYMVPRAMRPGRIVETGVAFGHSSALLLAALEHNGAGSLVSIDLPAHAEMAGDKSGDHIGVMVPQEYHHRWDLRRDDARSALQEALAEGPIEIFSHDSDHSYRHMMFEYGLSSSYLPPRGVIISDDTRMNTAFHDFMHAVGASVHPHGKNDSVACAVLA